MQSASIPENESGRLAALRDLRILDTPEEEAYERITSLTAQIFDVPICLISLVDSEREWFKSCYGIDERSAERQTAFCAHAILSDELLVVEDALQDARFVDNPQVVDQGIRFYAGAPLKTEEGFRIGALCIKDTRPRTFSPGDQKTLMNLASVVMREFGQSRLVRLLATEVSRREGIEKDLTNRTEGLDLALRAGNIGTWVWDAKTDLIETDERLGPLFGLPSGSFPQQLADFLSLLHPDDRSRVEAQVADTVSRGTEYNTEYRVIWPDGSVHMIGARGRPVHEAGQVVRMTGVCWDLTNRWRTETALRESEAETATINRELVSINQIHESLLSCKTVNQVADVMTGVLAQDFGAYFARVWILRAADLCADCQLAEHCPSKEECLHLVSSSGHYTHTDGAHRRVPLGAFKIGLIAQGRGETISNDVPTDERVHDREWAGRHGLQSFAGFPLLNDGKVIGVLAMFSQQHLPQHMLETLGILAKLGAIAIKNLLQLESLEQQNEQIKQYAKQLQDKQKATEAVNLELAHKNAELDEFTYVASHDLQEPLRKLVSFSSLLERDAGDNLPETAKKDLNFITDAAGRMSKLIQDLLQLSRAGRLAMVRDRICLNKCVDRALEALAGRVAETGPRIVRDPLPEIVGDRTLLTQLFQNLIGNALKFVSPDRSPAIRITAQRSNGHWIVGVEDNRIGIEPQYTEQIFAPFSRLHGQDEYPGSGIGLSICRKAVERHGGTIWVEPGAGEGSHFRFTIGAEREAKND